MKIVGCITFIVGIVVVIVSLNMDTTAIASALPGEVYNLGLLQHQMMTFVAGCSIAIMGAAFLAAGLVANPRWFPEQVKVDQVVRQAAPLEAYRPPALTEDEQAERRKQDDRSLLIVLGGAIVFVLGIVLWSYLRA